MDIMEVMMRRVTECILQVHLQQGTTGYDQRAFDNDGICGRLISRELLPPLRDAADPV